MARAASAVLHALEQRGGAPAQQRAGSQAMKSRSRSTGRWTQPPVAQVAERGQAAQRVRAEQLARCRLIWSRTRITPSAPTAAIVNSVNPWCEERFVSIMCRELDPLRLEFASSVAAPPRW
jgi:hypothetical protein